MVPQKAFWSVCGLPRGADYILSTVRTDTSMNRLTQRENQPTNLNQARTKGGFVGFVRTPPSVTCSKQKSEPNHFVAVQELIEGSELEASLKRLEVSSYAFTTALSSILLRRHWVTATLLRQQPSD